MTSKRALDDVDVFERTLPLVLVRAPVVLDHKCSLAIDLGLMRGHPRLRRDAVDLDQHGHHVVADDRNNTAA